MFHAMRTICFFLVILLPLLNPLRAQNANKADPYDPAHFFTMIKCDEADKPFIYGINDAFWTLYGKREIAKGKICFPIHLTEQIEWRETNVLIWWGYYTAPNEPFGFELVIPKGSYSKKDGILTTTADLAVESEDWKQGSCILILKPKNSQSSPSRKP